ncbi:unnamed protein product [Moneuplotes crassus]|uniref:EF-hand domain-containing protein n=1 Tax=Euplotes crassus TaxID=5936 RepID=A0AAD1U5K5_EUPCR|nr:unnamed protein product [Moneuplotes crassus]
MDCIPPAQDVSLVPKDKDDSSPPQPVKKVVKCSKLKKIQKEFYKKQMNYVENKYSKIYQKLIHKEKQLEHIHLKAKPHLKANKSLRDITQSDLSYPNKSRISKNSKVHERLYNENSERKVRKNILNNLYQSIQQKSLIYSRRGSNVSGKDELHCKLKTSRVSSIKMGSESPGIRCIKTNKNKNSRKIKFDGSINHPNLSKSRCNSKITLKTSQRLYEDAISRKKSKERLKFKISPKNTFTTKKSSQYLVGQFLKDFNEAFTSNDRDEKGEISLEKAYQIMQMLGFIRSVQKYSNSEVNSDRQSFMHFCEEMNHSDETTVKKEKLLQYTLAIQGYDFKGIQKNESLLNLYSFIQGISNVPQKQRNRDLDDNFSICDLPEAPFRAGECLSKKEIKRIHHKFLNLARNRSDFNKFQSRDKYKRRESHDDHLRDKPAISKRSEALAVKIREQFGDEESKLVDIRNKSSERSKFQSKRASVNHLQNSISHGVRMKPKYKTKRHSKGSKSPPQAVARKVILSVDINFGENLKDHILVHNGDNIPLLSKKFAQKHQLSTSLEQKLVQMLEDQLGSALHNDS